MQWVEPQKRNSFVAAMAQGEEDNLKLKLRKPNNNVGGGGEAGCSAGFFPMEDFFFFNFGLVLVFSAGFLGCDLARCEQNFGCVDGRQTIMSLFI